MHEVREEESRLLLHRLHEGVGGPRIVDGVAANLDKWPIFEGPWMNSVRGTGIVTLEHAEERHIFDFNE